MAKSRLKIWIEASRPKTLWAAVIPVLMGTALAVDADKFHFLSAVAALLAALLLQIGTNFSNDYFDFVRGADDENRVGPRRATQAGLIAPGMMHKASALTYLLVLLIAICLSGRAGSIVLLIAILSTSAGFFYTGGPRPLAYLGLGDFFVLIFFGPIAVGGTYYVQALDLTWIPFIIGLGPGLLSVAILTVNNLRDIETDRKCGKRTLVVRLGEGFGRLEYVMSISLACFIPVLLAYNLRSHFGSLLAVLVWIVSIRSMQRVLTKSGAELNPALGTTGKLLLLYGLLFSMGWLL